MPTSTDDAKGGERPTARSTAARIHLVPALVLLGLLAASGAARAGPWGRDFGSAYLKVGLSYYNSGESFSRGISTGLDYEAFTTDLFAEVGLPGPLTLVVDLPYVVATNTAPSGVRYTNHTFGDGRFEVDARILQRIPLSLGLEAKVPLYDSIATQDDGGVIEVDGRPWPSVNFPDVGDDNVDLTSKVLFGHSFYPFPAWATAELGYRARLAGYADGLFASLGAGLFVWPDHLILGVYSDGVVNVQANENPAEQASREYLYVQGYVQVTAAPWAPSLGLTLSSGGVVVAENSSTGFDLGVSVSYDFR